MANNNVDPLAVSLGTVVQDTKAGNDQYKSFFDQMVRDAEVFAGIMRAGGIPGDAVVTPHLSPEAMAWIIDRDHRYGGNPGEFSELKDGVRVIRRIAILDIGKLAIVESRISARKPMPRVIRDGHFKADDFVDRDGLDPELGTQLMRTEWKGDLTNMAEVYTKKVATQ